MFDKMKDAMKQLQMMQKLMKDEHVRALISHPKVRDLFMDHEFQALVKAQDTSKLLAHPKFTSVMRDPEVAALMAKVNPQQLIQGLS